MILNDKKGNKTKRYAKRNHMVHNICAKYRNFSCLLYTSDAADEL